MNLQEALEALAEGKRVRSASWAPDEYWEADGEFVITDEIGDPVDAKLLITNRKLTDWQIAHPLPAPPTALEVDLRVWKDPTGSTEYGCFVGPTIHRQAGESYNDFRDRVRRECQALVNAYNSNPAVTDEEEVREGLAHVLWEVLCQHGGACLDEESDRRRVFTILMERLVSWLEAKK